MKKFLLAVLLFMASSAITSQAAVNLTITGGSVPNSMYLGGSYTVSINVHNSGTTSTTANFIINISIHTAQTYGSGQQYITDIFTTGGVPAGGTRTFSKVITVPCNYSTGIRYILAGADAGGAIVESNENDNNFSFGILAQAMSDLVPLSYSLSSTSVNAGATVNANFAVNNDGAAAAGNFNVGFYLSTSATLNIPPAVLLGTLPVGSVPACGQTTLLTKSLTIPSGTCSGNYFLHMWIDNGQVITEIADNNNFQNIAVTVTGGSSPAAPVATAPNNITQTSFRANWNTVSGATGYRVDVSANASFSSFIAGYNNTDAGNSTSLDVTGLNCNTNYFYRVRAYNSCGNTSTSSSSVTATTTTCCTNSTAPSSATANPSGITSGGSSTLTVNGGSCGGTLVGTGASVSVSPTATTTYFVRAEGGNTTTCASVTVTVTASCSNSTAPTSATASPSNIVTGGTSTLTVNGGSLGSCASWKWYSGSCGGTVVGTGASVTVSPTATTTYFVRAEGGNTTTCASVTVTVTASCTNSIAPTGATATPSSVATGGSSTLTVNGGTLGSCASWKWYSGSCGGTLVGSVTSVSVSPTATTTYFVRAEGGNTTTCASVTVTVTASCTNSTAPTSATATPSSIATGGSSTLTVNGGSLGSCASWKWYSGSCGGTAVGTGASVTVSPTATTTYFVRAEGGNTTTCASVTVTVSGAAASITINYANTVIPPWQREGDDFDGKVSVTRANPAAPWHLEIDVHNSAGTFENAILYPPITGTTQNFSTASDAQLRQYSKEGKIMKYYAVLDNTTPLLTALVAGTINSNDGKTYITGKRWVKENIVLFNETSQELRIPLKYVPGATKVTVGFCRNHQLSSSYENIKPAVNSTQCNTAAPGCLISAIYGQTYCSPDNSAPLTFPQFCQSIDATTPYFRLPVNSSNNLRDIMSGVFEFVVTYHNNVSCPSITGSEISFEKGTFDLVKIGNVHQSRFNYSSSNNNKVIVLIGGSLPIEKAIKGLPNNVNINSSYAWSIANDLSLGNNSFNTWYIDIGNLNPLQKNAYNIGVALERIKELCGFSNPQISVIAHSKGALEMSLMMKGKGLSNSSQLDYNLNPVLAESFNNPSISNSLKSVTFTGGPFRGVKTSGYYNLSFAPLNYINQNLVNTAPIIQYLSSGITAPTFARIANITAYRSCNLSDGAVEISSSEFPYTNQGSIKQFYLKNEGEPQDMTGNILCGVLGAVLIDPPVGELCDASLTVLGSVVWQKYFHHAFMTSSYTMNKVSSSCPINTGNNTSTIQKIIAFINNDNTSTASCISPNTQNCPSVTAQLIKSELTNATISKINTPNGYKRISTSDEKGFFTLQLDDSLSLGDSILIAAPNVESMIIPMSSNSMKNNKQKIAFMRTQVQLPRLMSPNFRLISQTPITSSQSVEMELKAVNAISCQVKKNRDPIFSDVVNDKAIVQLDTGYNLIIMRFNGPADTIVLYKELYYFPESLINQFTIKCNLQTSQELTGSKLYVDGQFYCDVNQTNLVIRLLKGVNELKFTRFGYTDTVFVVDAESTISLSMKAFSYSSASDSVVINFNNGLNPQYLKTVTVKNTSPVKNKQISIKQLDDNYAGFGLKPQSRKFVFRNLDNSVATFRTALVLDQKDTPNKDSVYILVKTGNNWRKIQANQTGFTEYEPEVQKIAFDSLRFTNNDPVAELTLMKKQPPVFKAPLVYLSPGSSAVFPFSKWITDPDLLTKDVAVTIVPNMSNPAVSAFVRNDSIVITSTSAFTGDFTLTLEATHDFMKVTKAVTVKIAVPAIPVNTPVVYPNPATESINIDFILEDNDKSFIRVYNTIGQLVKTIEQTYETTGYKSVTMDISSLPAGMYIITLNHSKTTAKFIKQ